MPAVNIKFLILLLQLLPALFWSPESWSFDKIGIKDCRSIDHEAELAAADIQFNNALLWRVSLAGTSPSYLFGTMHVSDPRILDLPEPVEAALHNTEIFVMEVLMTNDGFAESMRAMFYQDNTRLTNYVDNEMFDHITGILAAYGLTPKHIAVMRPWAAFLTMSYPPDNPLPLDMKLLKMASSRGSEIRGLETVGEQMAIFSAIPLPDQLQLLIDIVCNYDNFGTALEAAKQLYLDRNIYALLAGTLQYNDIDMDLYGDFHQRLLFERNRLMADRMQSFLRRGSAFVAIGALHLPGRRGVLADLSRRGYHIEAIY